MQSKQIRQKFLDFFEKRGHAIIPSASLVTPDEKGATNSTLFNTAGMQPLIPYLLGEEHPKGKRLASVQKCIRTVDIDEVGDRTHLTFFEMLGNWSLGDYFKEESISWSWELLTSEEGLKLDPKRIYITVFEGGEIDGEDIPRDEESIRIWTKIFEENNLDPEKRILFKKKDNWWSAGENSPAGVTTEIFYDLSGDLTDGLSQEEFEKFEERQDLIEIWNNVFMEYEKKEGKVVGKLAQKNVDTGAGFERLVTVLQGKDNIFETDLFISLMDKISLLTNTSLTSSEEEILKAKRIITDHIRTAVFLISDGVIPANTDRGYILRRVIRRAIRFTHTLKFDPKELLALAQIVIDEYGDIYESINTGQEKIISEIKNEIEKFSKTLEKGLKEFEKGERDAFLLFSSYGFPIEMTIELAKEKGGEVDVEDFEKKLAEHQKLSRKGAEKKFKGGLADEQEETMQFHTIAHLLLAGLRKVLGDDVQQAGANITSERLRFDFTYHEKVGRERLDQVEDFINNALAKNCNVLFSEMKKDDAIKKGVTGNFWDRYPDIVKVYEIKDESGEVYSQELCGGPHIKNTKEVREKFKIIKEQASSAGVRRVKGVIV